jgi:hypothetical protein
LTTLPHRSSEGWSRTSKKRWWWHRERPSPQLASCHPVAVVVRRGLLSVVALSAVTALLARAVLADDARATTLITPLAAPTPVRAWAGIALLSIREAGGAYRLDTQQGREAPRPVPGIAPASQPFDANIGPGPSGAPLIVFARCVGVHRCGLMRTTLAGGVETPIGAPAGPGNHDHAPAVWGDRLAFARPARHGSDWVYVVPLEAGKRVRAMRLRSAPLPKCDPPDVSGGCFAAHLRPSPTELSLRGSMLAEVVELGFVEEIEGCPRTEVRLIDISAHRRGEQVKQEFCGIEGGETLLGVSLTATHLLYATVCPGDETICGRTRTLVYRYGLRDHRTMAAPERDLITGFAALDDDHAVEVSAPQRSSENPSGEDCTRSEQKPPPPCELVRVGPIRFKRSHFTGGP